MVYARRIPDGDRVTGWDGETCEANSGLCPPGSVLSRSRLSGCKSIPESRWFLAQLRPTKSC